jgi:hypothetical protein
VVRAWATLSRELLESAGIAWEEPLRSADRNRYFNEELPGLMLEVARDRDFQPAFDALVVDEGQDHDTLIQGSQGDDAPVGWWEIYCKLLREGTEARMAIFCDPAQRPLFRDREKFNVSRLRQRLSQAAHVKLPFTLRYTRPVFRFLQTLNSEPTKELISGLRHRVPLPEGPEVETYEVPPEKTAAKVREIVLPWVTGGFCRTDEILILSPHSRKAKTSLVNCTRIGEWPLAEEGIPQPGRLTLLSINKAKGMDSLAVILVDLEPFATLSKPQDQLDYFMGASRARQLLAIVHRK